MAESKEPSGPQHDEAESFSEEPTDNPFANIPITYSVPSSIDLEFVEVRSLGSFELWFSISSAMLSIAVGFFVGWIDARTAHPEPNTVGILGVVTLLFLAMTLGAVVVTIYYRIQLKGRRKTVPYRRSDSS